LILVLTCDSSNKLSAGKIFHFPSNKHPAHPLSHWNAGLAVRLGNMNSDDSTQADWIKSVMERHAAPLTRYAMLITADLERARDVVQDTFVKLCDEDRGQVEPHLAQWLFKVCRNRALDVQRKESRMTTLTEIEMNSRPSAEPSPAMAAEQRETTSELLRLVATLPKNQQEVVRLKFQNDLSYQEISAITNLTVTNVGFLIHTAIKNLRQQLQPKPGLATNPRTL